MAVAVEAAGAAAGGAGFTGVRFCERCGVRCGVRCGGGGVGARRRRWRLSRSEWAVSVAFSDRRRSVRRRLALILALSISAPEPRFALRPRAGDCGRAATRVTETGVDAEAGAVDAATDDAADGGPVGAGTDDKEDDAALPALVSEAGVVSTILVFIPIKAKVLKGQ